MAAQSRILRQETHQRKQNLTGRKKRGKGDLAHTRGRYLRQNQEGWAAIGGPERSNYGTAPAGGLEGEGVRVLQDAFAEEQTKHEGLRVIESEDPPQNGLNLQGKKMWAPAGLSVHKDQQDG